MISISVSGEKKKSIFISEGSNKEAFTSNRVAFVSNKRVRERFCPRFLYVAPRSYRARLSPTENSSACYSQSDDRLKYPSTGRASLFPAKAWTFKRARIDWKGQKLAALVQIGAH